MAKNKILITKIHRFFTLEEVNFLFEIIAEKFNNGTYQLREITKNAYTIQIIKIDDIEKQKLKKELKEIMSTIYKTDDTWKDIVTRQKERDLKNHQLTDYEKEIIKNS